MKKIIFPLIRGKSGADVYFENIKECVKDKVDISINYYKNINQFLPFLINTKNLNGDMFHCTSGEILWNLKNKKQYKIISILHLMYENDYKHHLSFSQRIYYNTLYKKYLKKSLPHADKIISISKYTQKKLKEELGYDSEVIYPCINTEIFKPYKKENNEKIKLSYSGNFSKRKGFDLLPKIIENLDDSFELSCTGLRNQNKIFRKIKYLGKLDKNGLVKAYNDCDIFLSTSRLEGFGLSVAEAMSCGKPCVVTNSSSLPELIDEKGGFLCERDNINDFVEKIKTLAKDRKLRDKMGKYNRKKVVNKFSFKALRKKYLELYNL